MPDRRTARIAGALFIVGTVAGGVAPAIWLIVRDFSVPAVGTRRDKLAGV